MVSLNLEYPSMRKLGFLVGLGLLAGCAQGGVTAGPTGAQVVSTFHDEIEIFLPQGVSRAEADRLARLHCSGGERQLSPARVMDNGNLLYRCYDLGTV